MRVELQQNDRPGVNAARRAGALEKV